LPLFLQAAADAYGELEDLRDELRAAQAAKAVGKQQAAELTRLKREQRRATAELQQRLDAAAVRFCNTCLQHFGRHFDMHSCSAQNSFNNAPSMVLSRVCACSCGGPMYTRVVPHMPTCR